MQGGLIQPLLVNSHILSKIKKFSLNFCILEISISLSSTYQNRDIGLKIMIFASTPLEDEEKFKKSIKFECKMVDNHWERLVLGLGYRFLPF